jgi:hypothetical protein
LPSGAAVATAGTRAANKRAADVIVRMFMVKSPEQ